jgi:hypothetical protein
MRQRSTAIRAVSEPEKKAEVAIRNMSPSSTNGQSAKLIVSPFLCTKVARYYSQQLKLFSMIPTANVFYFPAPISENRVSLASGHALWYIESEGWSAVHGFPSPQKPLLSKEKTGLLPTSRGFLV